MNFQFPSRVESVFFECFSHTSTYPSITISVAISMYTNPSNLAVFGTKNFGTTNLETANKGPSFSSKSEFGTLQPLNSKTCEFEKTASLEPRICEGLVYLGCLAHLWQSFQVEYGKNPCIF